MMTKEILHTDNAPKAVGPYSQAVRVGQLLFSAGQIALDPATMQLVAGGVEAETEQVLKNLAEVLASAESSFDHVVKTTIYLTNMDDYKAVNAIYAQRFSEAKPARSTVAVAALPLGAKVEIELIALIPTLA